ncbi:MAG: hypothetical protein JST86_10370 [Bacteroidetes bacterium]|nr:hypothetical protein [Bacteroidota bacterium]
MKTLLLYMLCCFTAAQGFSQDCTVNVDSLKGTYTGDCKKGKANGKGTAKGTDEYTGDFKDGYPDGNGKYIWQNGNWYEGGWKKGAFEGQGTLSKKGVNKDDSVIVISGYWHKNEYKGQYEKPFVVTALSNDLNDLSTRKLGNSKDEIMITVKNITGGASNLSYNQLPKARLTDIQMISGKYDQLMPDETSSPVSNKYIIRNVTFPFHAILTFETGSLGTNLHPEKVDVEIFENGYWSIQVNIDN